MHPSNIMHLLRELDTNSEVDIHYDQNNYRSSISITAKTFHFICDEDGAHIICWGGVLSDPVTDLEIWKSVKSWVKDYLNEVL